MDAKEATPRARAAWAYTGLDQKEFADRISDGVGYHRLRAILAASNKGDVSLEELYAIADAAGVPRSFMIRGWEEESGEVSALEARVDQLSAWAANRDAAMLTRIAALESAIQGLQDRRQR